MTRSERYAPAGQAGMIASESSKMVCEHLAQLEAALIESGARETFRGAAWSQNCREWVYFDCFIDTDAVQRSFSLPECVVEHSHRGTHDGQERGFVCSVCYDAVMGRYEPTSGVEIFSG